MTSWGLKKIFFSFFWVLGANALFVPLPAFRGEFWSDDIDDDPPPPPSCHPSPPPPPQTKQKYVIFWVLFVIDCTICTG